MLSNRPSEVLSRSPKPVTLLREGKSRAWLQGFWPAANIATASRGNNAATPLESVPTRPTICFRAADSYWSPMQTFHSAAVV